MTTAATSLLGLALPVTGELQGTWGTTVNDSITSLLDTAVAGTTTLSTDGDVTLSTTTLAANQARQAILLCSGARTALRTITAPAQSKIYTIINATTGGYAVKIVGVGPTTGISIPAGQTATVAWNGSDFVDASNYTNGNKYINGNLTVTGTTTLSGGTANGVAYLNGSKVVTTGSALTFDGTTLVSSRGASNGVAAQFGRSSGQSLYVYVDTASVYLGSDNGANTAWQLNETSDYIAGWLGGSEQMRLTSTGLGIGTSSPAYKLDVSATAVIPSRFISSATATTLAIDNTNANGWGSNIGIYTGGTVAGYFGTIGSLLGNTTQDLAVYASAGNAFRVYTNGNNLRAIIDSSGNLGLGVTPSAWNTYTALQVKTASLWSGNSLNSFASLTANAYYQGGYKYIASDYATEYYQYQGAHVWRTVASGTAGNAITFTQAMTLDASGQLVIGNTSATAKLDVYGASGNTIIHATDNTNADLFVDFPSSSVTRFTSQYGTNGQFVFANGTGKVERARIDSSGNLLVGTTSTVGGASLIAGAFAGNAKDGFHLQDTTTTSGTIFAAWVNSSGTIIGSISRVATTNAVAYNTTSDERLKSNIEDSEPALDKLMQVQVRQFDWTEGNLHQDYGFIAQELEPVLSGVVTKSKTEEDFWQLDYARLTPHLVKAIQEQQALIQTLTERISALEAK